MNFVPTDCEKSKACAPLKHHFDECTKRVEEGKGFEGENCIEEFCKFSSILILHLSMDSHTVLTLSSVRLESKIVHLAHCAQECTAPKLFSKLV